MAGMYSGGISGSLVQRFWLDVPGSPGNANPDAHRTDDDHEDSTHSGNSVSELRNGGIPRAPMGGAIVASDVTEGQVQVLPGEQGQPNRNHTAAGSHKGTDGRGDARLDLDLNTPLDVRTGGMHTPASLATAGTGGAAFGGLRRSGTMDPSSNPAGVDLGHGYVPVTVRRRQGLHFNRPGLRAIRTMPRQTEQDSPSPGGTRTSPFNPLARLTQGGGPSMPRLRRLLRPVGSSSDGMDPIDQAPILAVVLDPGPIGDEWVR